jgi:DNA gyrase subunit A
LLKISAGDEISSVAKVAAEEKEDELLNGEDVNGEGQPIALDTPSDLSTLTDPEQLSDN